MAFIGGTEGNDTLTSLVGDDRIDGAGGRDVAVFHLPEGTAGTFRRVDAADGTIVLKLVTSAGEQDVFIITPSATGAATVRGVGIAASLGTDTLSNIEEMHFHIPHGGGFDPTKFVGINLVPVQFGGYVAGSIYSDTINFTDFPGAVNANGDLGDDVITGSEGNDGFGGGSGDDRLNGAGGNDNLSGEGGDDRIDGGTGRDAASFRLPVGTSGTLQLVDGIGTDAGKLLVQLVNGGAAETVAKVTITAQGAAIVEGTGLGAFLGTDTVSSIEELHIFVPSADGSASAPGQFLVIALVPTQYGNHVAGSESSDTINLADYPGAVNANGNRGDDTIIGTDVQNHFYGDAGNDVLEGRGGSDYLRGGEGDDRLDGGTGEYNVAGFFLPDLTGNLRLVEAADGTKLVQVNTGSTFETIFEITLTGAGSAVVKGVGLASHLGTDTVTNVHALHIDRNGADTFIVRIAPVQWGGGPWVDGTDFGDTIAVADYPGALNIFGGGGDDRLIGSNQDNYFIGGSGNDTIDGVSGSNDVASFQLPAGTVGRVITVDGQGQDAGKLLVQLVNNGIAETFLKVTVTGTGSAVVQGVGIGAFMGTDTVTNIDELHVFVANTQDPQTQHQTINLTTRQYGEFVAGSEGADTIELSAYAGAVNANGNRGDDTVIGTEVQNHLHGGAGNDVLEGRGGNDVLHGEAGNDTLRGGADDDYLIGGAGNDSIDGGTGSNDVAAFNLPAGTTGSYRVVDGTGENAGKLLVERVDGNVVETVFIVTLSGSSATVQGAGSAAFLGTDTVTNVDELHFLPQGPFDPNKFAVINLSVKQFGEFVAGSDASDTINLADYSGAVNANGNRGDDAIVGTEARNVIHGGAGNDILEGRGGDDNLQGDAGDDTLRGGADNDYLIGGAGNDSIDGGTGSNDIAAFNLPAGTTGSYRVVDGTGENAGKLLVERVDGNVVETVFIVTLSGSSATVQGAGSAAFLGTDTVTNIDELHFLPQGPFDPNKFAVINLSVKQFGNFVQGSEAADNINFADFPGAVNSNGGRGNDTIIGNAENNRLNGNAGDDVIYGRDGHDTLLGEDGNDSLYGEAGNDALRGHAGNDFLSGGEGHDFLRGHEGDDTLLGGDGHDFLTGDEFNDASPGNDILNGGPGVDRASFFNLFNGVTVDLRVTGPQNTGRGLDTLVHVENVSGTTFDDVLIGNDEDNHLWGSGGGNDRLIGNGGNDLLSIPNGNHVLDGGSGIDTVGAFASDGTGPLKLSLALQGQAQDSGQGMMTLTNIENLSGTVHNDELTGDDNANVLAGDAGSDILKGGGGNDTLLGDGAITVEFIGGGSGPIVTLLSGVGEGNDTLDGGEGDDTLNGGGGSDTATYASATGGVNVNLSSGTATGAAGQDTLISIENVIGSAFADQLTGNGDANVLRGGDGDDFIVGLNGNDQIYGDAGSDILFGDAGDDTIEGGAGHDFLRGGVGSDTLLGDDGDDFLSGGLGDDVMQGGAGLDRVAFSSGATAGVTVDLNIVGVAQNTGQGLDTLASIEHISGTRFDDVITGDGGDNWLWGGSDGSGITGNDRISAGAGNDLVQVGTGTHILDGGSGTDTLSLDGNGSDVTSVGVTMSLLLQGSAQDTEQGMMTLNGFENLSGSPFDDQLTGDGGNNLLAGHLGSDLLIGGAGNDILLGDGVVQADTHGSGGSGPIVTLNDVSVLTGGVAGNDTLDGGDGDDTLNGGGGSDTATYASASGGVNVNLSSGIATGAAGRDTLISIENVIGSAFADQLTGNSEANVLRGGQGNDRIEGRAGNDTIDGDAGDDLLRGDGGDDRLTGGAGNDNLRGGAGVDYFDGGENDERLQPTSSYGDRVSFYELSATQGVIADLRSGTISNDGFGNVETMVGIESLGSDTAFVDTFFGNDGRNALLGNRGDNLYGFGGDDLIYASSAPGVVDGGAGIDMFQLDAGGGWLVPDTNGDGLAEEAAAATAGWVVNLAAGSITDGYGNTGRITGIENVGGSILGDRLTGDALNNSLEGNDGDDTLDGGDGDDTLIGGTGKDMLSGGAGRDTFKFLSIFDSRADAPDLITDFSGARVSVAERGSPPSQAQGDKIDLSAIDADVNTAGDQAFALVRNGFSGKAGEAFAEYDARTNKTSLFLDVNGDGVADMTISFLGRTNLSDADFIF